MTLLRRSPRLRVVIDARLRSGESGGVEGVVIGLASGLSQLDGPEDYVFAGWDGHANWLAPYVGGPARLVTQPPPEAGPIGPAALRKRVGEAAPAIRAAWQWAHGGPVTEDTPRRDEFVERLRPGVVHQPIQRGFLARVPSIYHPHDLQHVHLPEFFSPEERAWRERWYGTLCRAASMVAVATEWTREDVSAHFRLAPEQVRVVPLAPPLAATRAPTPQERAEVRRRFSLPDRYLLYPAQTWPHKNHIRLLEALAILRDREGLVVPLVASGLRNDFFATIAGASSRLGLDDQVTWTDFVSPVALQGLYLDAHAVVVPSLFEAASGPLWEAFTAGVPAACSNVTSLPAQAGDAAVVFDPADPEAIAEAVRGVWLDDERRRRLIAAGRERVAGLSWQRTAETFRAHYRRLAGVQLSARDRELIGATTGTSVVAGPAAVR